MFELSDFLTGLVSFVATITTVILTAGKRTQMVIHERLDKITGGKIASLEDLVERATREERLRRDTPITVHGDESLWRELRKGGFAGALLADRAEKASTEPDVVVIDTALIGKDEISKIPARYALLYIEKGHYDGPTPPGAQVTYANSSITLDARLMEALRHLDARSRDRS